MARDNGSDQAPNLFRVHGKLSGHFKKNTSFIQVALESAK
jgi:hypothetical protein